MDIPHNWIKNQSFLGDMAFRIHYEFLVHQQGQFDENMMPRKYEVLQHLSGFVIRE